MISSSLSAESLSSYFDGKTIFCTGLTGCLGLATAEKLLRCTNVAKIYALVRAQTGQEQERLERLWDTHLPSQSETMRAHKKVIALKGDITAPNLGLSEEVIAMLRDEVSIVLHMSADINLRKSVKDLAATNITGALAVAELSSSFPGLERYVHVSSIYSHAHLSHFDEEVYSVLDPEEELLAVMRGEPLVSVGSWIFDYTYTKNLAERLLLLRYPELPTLIYRPSVIGPAVTEPEPLWSFLDSMPLLNFFTMAAQMPKDKAIVWSSSMFPGGDNFFDEVPIDYVVSTMLAHTAAGTLGAVHGNTGGSQQMTYNDIIEDITDLLPPQEYAGIPIQMQKGLPSVFKIMGTTHPAGSDKKTRQLAATLSEQDLNTFPIDLAQIDLKSWHRAKGKLLRKNLKVIADVKANKVRAKL